MALDMVWKVRNDVWLDNGLELFGQIADHISRQHPEVLKVKWFPDELHLTIYNVDRFIKLLEEEIQTRIIEVAHYTDEKSRSRKLKRYIPFHTYKDARNYPLIFQNKTRSFLEEVFNPRSGVREKERCLFCGGPVGKLSNRKLKLTLSVYPFVTKIKSLSGIRTWWNEDRLEGFTDYMGVCSKCYFLGALVWIDDALLYLCDVDGAKGLSIVLLPVLDATNLLKLKQLKFYRPKQGGRRSNVQFKRRPHSDRGEEKGDNFCEERYSLLLAFLEQVLEDISLREEVEDLFAEVTRHVSDSWLLVVITQTSLKKVLSQKLVLSDSTLNFLVRLVEKGILPYSYIISEMRLRKDNGELLKDETSRVREALAKAILTDDFDSFSKFFIPKPKRQLHFSLAIEDDIKTLIQVWRWFDMSPETLEIIKKAGNALATIAANRRQPVLLYALERVRSSSDLLEVLKEGVHRLIGLEPEDIRYISLEALEQLTELIHQTKDVKRFLDLKNTLIVFAGIAYAKKLILQSRQG